MFNNRVSYFCMSSEFDILVMSRVESFWGYLMSRNFIQFTNRHQYHWTKMMEDTGEDILRPKPSFVSNFFKRIGQVRTVRDHKWQLLVWFGLVALIHITPGDQKSLELFRVKLNRLKHSSSDIFCYIRKANDNDISQAFFLEILKKTQAKKNSTF